MTWEEDAIRRMQAESGGGRPDRRGHYVKMGGAFLVMAACFGLFAAGVLGRRGAEIRKEAPAVKGKAQAAKALAKVSGPEMGALVLGGVAGIYFAFLLLRLRRFD